MYGDLMCGDENRFDFYENDLSVVKEIKKTIANLGCYQDNYVSTASMKLFAKCFRKSGATQFFRI